MMSYIWQKNEKNSLNAENRLVEKYTDSLLKKPLLRPMHTARNIYKHATYRKDMHDSLLHFFQDDPCQERMYPCYNSYILFVPFRLDKNLLKIKQRRRKIDFDLAPLPWTWFNIIYAYCCLTGVLMLRTRHWSFKIDWQTRGFKKEKKALTSRTGTNNKLNPKK